MNTTMLKMKMRRTLRLVNLALMELTKGFSDITIAPSLRSKNLGRKASFTVGYCVDQIQDQPRLYKGTYSFPRILCYQLEQHPP